MEKFRIGNDLTVFWAILDDDSQPYNLSGKTVKVFLTHPRGRMEITQDVNIQGNVISWLFRGERQRYLGVYKLTVEIFSSPSTRVLRRDIDQAFSLVSATLYVEESNGRPQINETGKLTLSTILEVYQIMPIVPQVGPNSNWWVDGVDTGKPSTGMSAYEFAKENGYTGTEEEYAAECADVPVLNEESREAADNADRAAGEARRSATVANSASATATNAALAANTAAKAANDAAEAANTAAELSKDQIEAVGRYIGNEVTPAAEAAIQAATKAINAAGSINGATDNANSAADAANAAATRAERTIEEFGPAIANKADLENGKIVASQIPDYLLGQVMFGGLIYINNSVIPTVNFDAKYGPFSGQYVIIDIHEYYKYEGVYFIAQEDGIILDIDVKVGDWIVSTGHSWEKIDNTDAVSSVAGLVGNVNASSLAAALADLTDSNSLARKTDLPKKLSELENDIEIGGGGGSYDDSEIKEILSNIVDEEGYLYSNGEKVDMRFTRSLLPVGTSIPARANLNTIEYLKIGKYYCSLNADAKTIKNCPVSVAFSMEVFNPLGTNVDDETTRDYTYRLRVLTQYDTGQQYMQFCRTNGTAGSWVYESWYVTPRVKFALASSKNDGSAAIGATNKGVYIDSTGEIKAMSYTVAKSVPSNAVFTDTNTKVTAVGNHYAPAEDESQQIDAPSGEVVTGIKRDAAGHVVGVVSTPQTGGGDGYIGVFGDGYIESQVMEDGTYLTTNVAENLDEVSARGQLADAYDIKTFVEDAINQISTGGGDSLWYEDSEGRAFCDRDIHVDGNISTSSTFIIGSIGVPAPEGGYRTGDSGQILRADGNGMVEWDDLSIPTKVSDLENDNVYITDFTVEDLDALATGNLDQLQFDAQGLMGAIHDHKSIIVPFSHDPIIGGEAILLGEVADTDIYFAVYTHQAYTFFCEAIEGVIYNWGIWGRHVTSTVEQTNLDTLKKMAIANAVQTDGLIYAFPDQATGEEDEVLLSRGTVKTINGQTIMRDGDSDDIITAYECITTNLSSVELLPNAVTKWAVPITSRDLVLNFADTQDQYYAAEYIAVFSVGADGVQLYVPENVVWADGVYPAMTPGKTYEISFVDNLATFLEF